MTLLMLMLMLAPAQADCKAAPPNHPNSAVGAVAPALGQVALEIPLVGIEPEPTDILAVLDSHGLKATLLVSHRWAAQHSEFLQNAADAGHEIGLWISLRQDIGLTGAYATEPTFSDWVDAIRTARRKTQAATGHRPMTMGMSTVPILGELAADAMGFRAVVSHERTINDRPRKARATSKSRGRARIIGQGKYDDGCGHLLPHWSPAALDRATHAAARSEWVRIGLPSSENVGPMLSRWITTVVIPKAWNVVTLSRMGTLARKSSGAAPKTPPQVAVARQVGPKAWTEIATRIAASDPLPTKPGHQLNLTEAFFGLVTLLASDQTSMTVTIGSLKPPTASAQSEIDGPTEVSPSEVAAMAARLQPHLRGQVPSLISVGDHSLTAAEALKLMAKAFLGEPTVAVHVQNPQIFAEGYGWGESIGL